MDSINVVLIEKENLIRIGVEAILSDEQKNIKVCGMAKSGIEGIELINKHQPDLVVMSVDLPDINGIDFINIIKQKYEFIKILVMTADNNQDTITSVLNTGASLYCKNVREQEGEILEAVIATYKHQSWIDPSIHHLLIQSLKKESPKNRLDLNELSSKEITVLKLTAQGLTNDAIANKIYVSEGTVRSYMHNIFVKLGVRNRLNAIRCGIRLGILDPEDLHVESAQESSINRTNQKSKRSVKKKKSQVA